MTIKLILQSPHFTAEQNKRWQELKSPNSDKAEVEWAVAALPQLGHTMEIMNNTQEWLLGEFVPYLTWTVTSIHWDEFLPIITVTGLKSTGEINESL